MRPRFTWRIGSQALELGARTLVMGVVNVTPDSFSDGGRFFDRDAAIQQALTLLDEGADIVDVGGESTRPGARVSPSGDRVIGSSGDRKIVVSAEEELARVLPVIEAVKRARPEAIISIDTYKAAVARTAVEAGAEIVNDVSAFRWDPEMAATVARLGCGAVLMHMRGRPEEWRTLPPVDDMVELVARELQEFTQAAVAAGVGRERIVLDPGFGFGKNFEENYPLLARFEEFHQLGFPLLSGTSRKSFVGRAMSRGGATPPPEQRLHGSVAAMVISILKGAHIVRVHDVRPAVEAAAVADVVVRSW